MPGEFDVYHKWLGIPPHEQPPTHYRLLGLAAFESDPDVIGHAADARMAHLKRFQAGRHSAWSQHLLNEVAAAKICLLNPERKAAYDGLLRGQLAPPPAPPEPVVAPPFHEAEGRWTPTEDVAEILIRPRLVRQRRRARWFKLAAVIVALACLAGGIYAVLHWHALRARLPLRGAMNPPSDTRRPAERRPPDRAPSDVADEQPLAARLDQARQEMAERNLTVASARVMSAVSRAETRADRQEIEQTRALLVMLIRFWESVDEALAKLAPGDRLDFGDASQTVVSAKAGEVVLRAANGAEHRYTPADMPPAVAVALADRVLPTGQATRHLCLGAFWAIDAQGDQVRAREHWILAGRQGESLLELLDK